MINIKGKITLLVCLALSFVMLLILSSCGGDNPWSTDDTQNSTQTETKTDTGIDLSTDTGIDAGGTPGADSSTDSSTDTGTDSGKLPDDGTDTPIEPAPKFTVSFDSNGGSSVEAIEVEKDQKAAAPVTPTRDGYTFDGWYYGEEKWSFVGYVVTENMTLVAKWTPNKNTVSFVANGGSGEMDNLVIPTDGTANLTLNGFIKDGYTFKGWATSENGEVEYENGAEYKMGTCESYTLFCVWEANENTLILIADSDSSVEQSLIMRTDDTHTLPAPSFQKPGYSIVGWSSESSGEIEYALNAEYTMGTERVYILYAVWEINVNDIILDMNDGTGEKEVTKLESFATFSFPINTYERVGYEFAGWSSTGDGDVEYTDGATYKSDTESEVVFYAVWNIIEYALTYNNAPELSTQKITFTVEDLPLKLPKLSNTADRLFECWYEGEALSGEALTKITAVGNYNLYPSYVDGTDGLVFIETDGGWQVGGYTGDTLDIVIPSYFCGNPVIAIGNSAFKGCNDITSVELPSELTTIGETAFLSCHAIEYITLPSTVTSIGKQAFSYCRSLKALEIPKGVTSLGSYAFYGCYDLESIIIPEGITEIEYQAFYGCVSLLEISLPTTVKKIDDQAFIYCESLIGMELPNNISTIGKRAFYGCEKLEAIVIPSTVKSIGDEAFAFCTKLENINIPSGITKISDSMFLNCISLEAITIPENITAIGEKAFKQCSSLSSIAIPDSVTSIGYQAFEYCENLKSVTLSEKLKSIGESAFYGCETLVTIAIPASVTTIGANAFKNCEKLYIYCELESQPITWSSSWNSSNCMVFWGES